jgi:DNA polymerase-3 subunit delta
VDFAALADAVASPPFMSDFKFIEWKYPQFDKMNVGELDALERLCELVNSTGYTVLAFFVADGDLDTGTDKRPSRFVKRFGEKMGIIRLDKSTDAQLISWLKKHFDAEGVGVTREALEALIFRSGHSMQVLHSEVIKLSAYAKANGLDGITPSTVNKVASSTAESDAFALSNAILDRNKKAAYDALAELKSQRTEPVIIISMMSRIYSDLVAISLLLSDGLGAKDIEAQLKMNSYKLKKYLAAAKKFDKGRAARILEELSRVDTGAKFGGVTGYTAVELFVAKCV